MNKELEVKLQDKYPKIFRDLYGDKMKTCMAWGCECGDGWYNLIDVLCGLIQWYIDHNDVEQVVAVQIKEKFGGLRFYYDGGDEVVGGYVSFAENMSYHICEECGNVGKQRKGGWIKTLCDEHDKNRKNPWKDNDEN